MKKFLALLALAGTFTVPASAETYGIAFASQSGVPAGYTATLRNHDGVDLFLADMNTRWDLGFVTIFFTTFQIRDDEVEMFEDVVAEVCWEGGAQGFPYKEGCRPAEWEMGWHSVFPLTEGEVKTN